MDKISVALAVYNGEKYLLKQLQSLVEQSFRPFEIVIINDNSTDDSEEIINSFNFNGIQVRYYRNKKNEGVIATFKKLIHLCEGDFIATCDQDDIWLPHKLKLSAETMLNMNQSKACVVYTDLKLINETDQIIHSSLYKSWNIHPEKYNFSLILIDNVIIGCTAFINKAMKNAIQKMPTNIIMHDYWIALIGYSFGNYKYIDDATILYRVHNNSITSKVQNSAIKNFEQEIRNQKNYLKSNIDQVRLFREIYSKYISNEQKKAILFLEKLENKNFIFKRIYAKWLKTYINRFT